MPSTEQLDELRTALVGKSLKSATVIAADLGFSIRIVKLDGKERTWTQEQNESRLNVEVESGVVVKVAWVG